MRNILFLLLWPMLSMAQIQTIPTGTGANTGTGIPLRNAFQIINGNFTLQNTQYAQTAAEIAVGVTPSSYGYPVLNALRYGCDPSGGDSSTTCFVSAGAVANAMGGGTIYVPCGTYLATNVVYIYSSVFLQGAGANCVFIRNNGTNTPTFKWGNGSANIFHGGISQITFSGASGVTGVNGQTGFSINKLGQAQFHDIFVTNLPSPLYRGVFLTTLSQSTIYDLQVQGATNDGITNVGGTDTYITDSRSDGNGGAGWVLNASQGGFYKHDTAFNDSTVCWYLHSGSPSTAPNKNSKFYGIVGDTCGNHDIEIDDCVECTFTDIWGATQQSTSVNTFATGIFIDSQYATDLTFNGGQALNTNSHCVQIFDTGSSAPTNITFNGFQFGAASTGCGKSGGTAYNLTNNGATNHIRINGGMFLSPLTGPWLNQSSATDIICTGNPIGLVCANQGAGVVATSSSSVTITHGLGFTPNLANIQITPTSSLADSGVTNYWISSATSTQFTLNLNAAATGSSFNFVWRASFNGT